jgi:DNA primase
VVTEGVYDALRLPWTAVALLSNTISARQARLLASGEFDEIIVCLDADQPRSHVEAQAQKLMGKARVVRIVYLQHGDPASYVEDNLLVLLGLKTQPPNLLRQKITGG